jgi:hypothetical protein
VISPTRNHPEIAATEMVAIVGGMISRPNFLLVAAAFAAMLLVIWVIMGPSPAYVWKQVDPVAYAASRVRAATSFTVPAETDEGALEAPLDSWRVIARSPVADSVFRTLASAPTAQARMYGIAGIALRDSAAANALARRFARDSTPIVARLRPCSNFATRRASELADSVRSPRFARSLLDGDAACRASSRMGRLTRVAAVTAAEVS